MKVKISNLIIVKRTLKTNYWPYVVKYTYNSNNSRAKISRIVVKGQLQQNVSKTVSQPTSRHGVSSVIPIMSKA
jgi:hypothetical protein